MPITAERWNRRLTLLRTLPPEQLLSRIALYGRSRLGLTRPKPVEETSPLDDPRLRLVAEYREQALRGHVSGDPSMHVHWVIPDFTAGAGGHMTLFRAMYWLEHAGHRNSVWITPGRNNDSAAAAKLLCFEHFLPLQAAFHFLEDGFEAAAGDVVVASDCWTVWPVLAAPHFNARAYFVQDDETQFDPAGARSLLAAQTYAHRLHHICAGPWLARKLAAHGHDPVVFRLAVDHDIYQPAPPAPDADAPDRPLRIAVYARRHTPRRAVELAWLGFARLMELGVRFEVHAFGQATNPALFPFPVIDHGVLAPPALAALYRHCDVGVSFSTTNYALTGQEMMACGLPLLELDGENTRLAYEDGAVVLCQPHPDAIAAALARLAREPAWRRQIAARGLASVAGLSWPDEMSKVVASLRQAAGRAEIAERVGGRLISVVLIIRDTEPHLAPLLAALRAQRLPDDIELIVLDHAAPGRSQAAALSDAAVRLVALPEERCDASDLRERALASAGGLYVAMVEQDMRPTHSAWLFNLVQSLDAFPDATAAIGAEAHEPSAPRARGRALPAGNLILRRQNGGRDAAAPARLVQCRHATVRRVQTP